MDMFAAFQREEGRRRARNSSTNGEPYRPTHLAPSLPTEESELSSAPSTPGPVMEEDGDFFLVQKIESPLSSREGSLQPKEKCPENPVDKLPSELLILILAKLSSPHDLLSCLLVSRGWARCCVDLLWHRPLFTNWDRLVIVADSLQREDAYWRYQDLIRRLNLSNLSSEISDGTLQTFVGCKRVERLTLTGCDKLTDQGVTALIEGNQSLLALDVTGLSSLTDLSLESLTRNCPRLQGLNITGCRNVTDAALVPLAEACKYLKRLKLNRCTNVTDVAIEAFARACPAMLEIDVQGCERITDVSLTTLMRSLMGRGRSLRELRLAQCNLVTDAAFLNLPTDLRCDTLRILDLNACHQLTDATVDKIITVAPRLRILVLAKCSDITDQSVFSICRLGKNLHDIHLGRCGRITDEALKELVKHCNRIRYIDLAGCLLVTDASVKLLATLPKLRRIGLVKCQNITDRSIRALASSAQPDSTNPGRLPTSSSLERVHLSYCVNITVQGIHELLNNCQKLTHLSLTGITDFFSRADIIKFCRDAPQEFNEEQRSVFCVFSGEGVNKLRNHLNEMEKNRSLGLSDDQMSYDGEGDREGQDVINMFQNMGPMEDFDE